MEKYLPWLTPLIIQAFLLSTVSPACLENCLTCSQTGDCLQCSLNNYVSIATAPAKGCLPCRPQCKTCASEIQACSTCSSGYYMSSETSSCEQCLVDNCLSCDDDPEQCSTCSTGYFLIGAAGVCESCSVYPRSLTCRQNIVLSCESGYYVLNGQICEPCAANCLQCTSKSYCLTCAAGYFGYNCQSCSAHCSTCLSSTNCLACSSGYYLQNKNCTQCPIANCLSCSSAGACTKCKSGTYLASSGLCQTLVESQTGCSEYRQNSTTSMACVTCQSGFYLSSSLGRCLQCSLLCSTCSNYYSSSSCSVCSEWGTAPTAGVCIHRPNLAGGQKTSYISNWNYPLSFSYLGTNKIIYNNACPASKFSTKARAQIGIISGYSISIRLKVVAALQQTLSSFSFSAKFNTISLANQTSTTSQLSKCSDSASLFKQYVAIHTYPLPADFSSFSLAPLSNVSVNYLELTSQTTNLFLSIAEVITIFSPCQSTCQICSSIACLKCVDSGMLIQEDRCVDKCSELYYLSEDRCLRACPVGTYEDHYAEEWACSACPSTCKICASASVCLTCASPYYLSEAGTCVLKCPDNYFGNSVSKRCERCSSPCLNCNSSTNCLSCSFNFLFNGTCLAAVECPAGTYPAIASMTCTACPAACLACSSQDTCTQCSAGYLSGGKCLAECPPGYYKGNNQCLGCRSPCMTCDTTWSNCTSCKSGFLLSNRCLVSCLSGYYEDYSTMSCQLCLSPCKTCVSSPLKCTSCITGYLLHSNLNVCLTRALCLNLTGSYILVESTNPVCAFCPSECKACSESACSSCVEGYYLVNNRCLITCPFGLYADDYNMSCLPCDTQCDACLAEPDFCISCSANRHLNYLGYCELGCQDTQVFPSCEPCQQPCHSCNFNTTFCTSCLTGYFMFESTGQCVTECYDMYYSDHESGFCKACTSPCFSCVSLTSCTSCRPNNYLLIEDYSVHSGTCVKTCPSGFFASSATSTCQVCSSSCSECSVQSDNCTSCTNGLLEGNTCLSECSNGKYESNGLCLDCVSPCKNCLSVSSQSCASCVAGYYFYNNTCAKQCPLGRVASDLTGNCEPCQFPCEHCSLNPFNCTKCTQPQCPSGSPDCLTYFLLNGSCLLSCPPTTYSLGPTCVSCPSPCLQCANANSCLSCTASTFFFSKACLVECPGGFYSDTLSGMCLKCLYPCKDCSGPLTCLSCLEGVRVENSCVMTDSCESGFYLQYTETNGVCQQCSSQCKQCLDSSDNCVVCLDPTAALLGGSCLESCPSQYYPQNISITKLNTTQIVCVLCPEECISCSSFTSCTQCRQGYYLVGDECMEVCPPKYYSSQSLQNPTCLPCSSKCRTCIHASENCVTCQASRYLYLGGCVQECPEGTYADSVAGNELVNGVCRQCDFPCQLCSQNQKCALCLEGFYISSSGFCIAECKPPGIISTDGLECMNQCPQTTFTLQDTQSIRCSTQCNYPFILNKLVTPSTCSQSCDSDSGAVYINEDLACVWRPADLAIIKLKIYAFIDAEYSPKLMIDLSEPVDSNQLATVANGFLELSISTDALSFASRSLQAIQYSPISYELQEQTTSYLLLSLNPEELPQPKQQNSLTQIKAEFTSNSNLLLRSDYTSLPVQSSSYTTDVPQFDSYREGPYDNFRVLGEVSVIFLLSVACCLLFWNWYAKIYESLHLLQLLFLLSVLEMRVPPNIWLFLQGFKNSHFYFIPNWFLDSHLRQPLCDSPPKMIALFSDSNFLRVCGHILCLLLIIVVLCGLFYLARFGKSLRWQWLAFVSDKLHGRLKLIKWSHIHDFVMSVAMIVVFGFFSQGSDYHTNSTIQSLAIVLSYICLLMIALYYLYMGLKLHRIVRMSEKDPRNFCDRNYLFRDNMMSITECAVHPRELYLNYVRAIRIVLFGAVIGIFNISPLTCAATIALVLIISAFLYLVSRPYPDDLQNILLGASDISTALGVIFLACQQFVSTDEQRFGQDYLSKKWVLGWMAIICFLVAMFLLIIELTVSIVRGNSSPLKLTAQDESRPGKAKQVAPNSLVVFAKRSFDGWGQKDDDTAVGFQYQCLDK